MISATFKAFDLGIQLAESDQLELPAEPWAEFRLAVEMNLLEVLSPEQRWTFLASGLMCREPRRFLQILRYSGALVRLVPELDALYGVPQLSDAAEPVDVGEHQERVLAEASKAQAPLAVRFAALMHKIGKGSTPPEVWPSHYKHEDRGQAALKKVAQRFRVPTEILNLAQLVIDECDRVHRASNQRAGAITVMVERVRALEEPERFEQLLKACTCDYAAYVGHTAAEYPKAERLRKAAAACRSVNVEGLDEYARLEARSTAVASALNSLTRSLEPDGAR
jgi:tRNA nucleotidyltransferase (CCA-adding enzyme)